jgi:steroid delta-isomerase-like uncharacterized protein
MNESDRNLGRHWFERVWNQGRREAIAEMFAADAVIHDGATDAKGPDGFYPFYDRLRATFSEIHVEVLDSFAEGEKVCVRWSFTGKHSGDGLGLPPTRRTVNVTGLTVLRVADGSVVECWQNWDMLGMMEQINSLAKSATYIG